MPFISKNPFTEEEYESFAFLTVEEITDAIKKSNEAYNQWRVKSLATRKAACYRLADLLNEQKERRITKPS